MKLRVHMSSVLMANTFAHGRGDDYMWWVRKTERAGSVFLNVNMIGHDFTHIWGPSVMLEYPQTGPGVTRLYRLQIPRWVVSGSLWFVQLGSVVRNVNTGRLTKRVVVHSQWVQPADDDTCSYTMNAAALPKFCETAAAHVSEKLREVHARSASVENSTG